MKIKTANLKARFVDIDNSQFPRKQQCVIDMLVKNNIELIEYAYDVQNAAEDDDYIVLFFHRYDSITVFEVDDLIRSIYNQKFEYIKIDEIEFSAVEIHIPVSSIHPYSKS